MSPLTAAVLGFIAGLIAMFFLSALLGADAEPPETIEDDLDDDMPMPPPNAAA